MKPRKELEAEYKKLARRADDRLRNIEKYSRRKGFEGIKEFAYRRAIKDIESYGGKKRFGSRMPKTTRKLQAKINAVKKFLESPTSLLEKTITVNGHKEKIGIIPMYEERAKRMNKAWGTNFNWQTLAKYYDSGLALKLENLVGGSDFPLKIIAQIQKAPDVIRREIEAMEGKYELVDLDDEEAVENFIKEQGAHNEAMKKLFGDGILSSKFNTILNSPQGLDILKELIDL